MHRVIEVRFLGGNFLQLHFEDDTTKVVDIKPFIGKGISVPLLEDTYFQRAEIDSAGGIVWPNGYDFCPNFLYEEVPALQGDSLRTVVSRQLAGSGRRFSPERDSVAELIAEREAEDSDS